MLEIFGFSFFCLSFRIIVRKRSAYSRVMFNVKQRRGNAGFSALGERLVEVLSLKFGEVFGLCIGYRDLQFRLNSVFVFVWGLRFFLVFSLGLCVQQGFKDCGYEVFILVVCFLCFNLEGWWGKEDLVLIQFFQRLSSICCVFEFV